MTAKTAEIAGYFNHFEGTSAPTYFDTWVPAELVSEFPKSVGVGVNGRFIVKFAANQANGGKNEAGVRRYRSFIKHATRLGIEMTWNVRRATNGYRDQDAFEAAIGL